MAKLEIFQNGNFSNGDPVYQIGSKNADGEYDISVFELMTEAEAKTKLKSMGGSPAKKAAPEKKAAPKKKEVVEEVEETSKTDLNQMTKLQLEEFAREFGVELDRREKKASLVKDAYKAQFDG
jgi:transposase